MGYAGVLLITILISFIIVRIGGFALQLTGIEPDVARFQALSAFSGAGFTTTEAERVVTHRTRRRIVTILIILGNAGLVTIMAALVASITTTSDDTKSTIITVSIIIVGIFALYALIIRSRVGNNIVERFRKPIMKRIMMEAPTIDEIYVAERDWGIHLVIVKEPSRNIGLYLADVTEEDITILARDRAGITLTKPEGKEKIVEGDRLLIYGNKKSIRRVFD